ncbi:MAG TPA: hypothetical protein VMM58_10910 [Bacteroidota bacterium]|nr:hypothetical protein [Bacteroidota bacterium]
MKKNAHKQRKKGVSVLKKILQDDGRKLVWLSSVTEIQYQRLQRIVNQGYDPTIREASKIAVALKKGLVDIFPSDDLRETLLFGAREAFLGRTQERRDFSGNTERSNRARRNT